MIAVFKWAAFVERSLKTVRSHQPTTYESQTGDIQLRDIINVADPRTPCNLRRVLLVLVQLRVNLLRDLWERISGITRPEEVLRIEVVRALLGLGDDDAVEAEF